MPTVRLYHTGETDNHISGIAAQRVKFVVIDDDLSVSLSSRDLAGGYAYSERYNRYRFQQHQSSQQDKSLGRASPFGNSSKTNPEQDVSRENNSTVGQTKGCVENLLPNKYKLFESLHSYYDPTQVSRITKLSCWGESPLTTHRPKIALLFELEDTIITGKFDWKDTPKASVFMCNSNGRITKLAYGDTHVSGLEFVSLGKPVEVKSSSDKSSFLSLIPGNDRAEEILDTLMDKKTLDVHRARWGLPSSIVLPSSEGGSADENDEVNFVCMKIKPSKKVTWNDDLLYPVNLDASGPATKASMERELVAQVGDLCHAPRELETGQNNLSSSMLPYNEPSHHDNLHQLSSPQFLSTETADMALKFQNSAENTARAGPQATESAAPDQDLAISMTFPKRRPEEFNRNTRSGLSKLDVVGAKYLNPVPEKSRLVLDQPAGIEFGGYCKCASRNHSTSQTNHSFPPLKIPANTIQADDQKQHSKSLDKDTCNCGKTREFGGGAAGPVQVDSSAAPDAVYAKMTDQVINHEPVNINDELKMLGSKPHSGPDSYNFNFDASVSSTCAVESPLDSMDSAFGARLQIGDTKKTIISPTDDSDLLIPPPDEICRSDDPVFDGCKIYRGFHPKYPDESETPLAAYQRKVGGIENWYKWPPVQVSAEYLPEGLKKLDWSGNEGQGEFVPGGISW